MEKWFPIRTEPLYLREFMAADEDHVHQYATIAHRRIVRRSHRSLHFTMESHPRLVLEGSDSYERNTQYSLGRPVPPIESSRA